MQYGPKIVNDGLVFFVDGTQNYTGDDAVKTPNDIPNCCLWLDADDDTSVVTSGSNVTQWSDKSGNGNDATVYSTDYPQYNSSYTINGRRAINFIATSNTAGDTLKGAFTTSGSNQPGQSGGNTRFIVCKQHHFVSTESDAVFEMAQGAYVSASVGNRSMVNFEGSAYQGNDRVRFYNQGTSSYAQLRGEGNLVILSDRVSSSSSNQQAFLNGYRWASNTATNYTFTHYCIGDDMTGGDRFNGYVCEVIIFNRVLTDSERLQVEFYLAKKWDIAFCSLAPSLTSQRQLKDLTASASVDNSSSSYNYYNPGIMPSRGIFYQKESGRRIEFNGTSNVQNLAGSGTSGELTIEWAANCNSRLDSGTNYYIFSNESYQNYGICIRYDGQTWRPLVRFSHGGSNSAMHVNTNDIAYAGEWAHWTVTLSGSNCKIYKDGTSVLTSSSFSAPSTSSIPTGSPFGDGSQSFNGEIAFVKAYNKALSADEIAQNYNASKSRITAIPKIPKPRDIQRYYDMDMFGRNADTTYWYDLSYNNVHNTPATTGATLVGPTYYGASNLYPKYYDLDGTDDRFTINSYTFGNGNWCFSVWVNVDSFSDVTVLSNSSGGPVTNAFGFDQDGSDWKMGYWNYGYANNGAGPGGAWYYNKANTTVSTKNWYMLTWVNYSDETMKMYLNGVADSSAFYSKTTNGGPCDIIGSRWNGSYFNGKMANFQIWDVALTDAEILQNFNYFKNRFGY